MGRDQADDVKLLRSINLDVATWEQARDAEATGKTSRISSPSQTPTSSGDRRPPDGTQTTQVPRIVNQQNVGSR